MQKKKKMKEIKKTGWGKGEGSAAMGRKEKGLSGGPRKGGSGVRGSPSDPARAPSEGEPRT